MLNEGKENDRRGRRQAAILVLLVPLVLLLLASCKSAPKQSEGHEKNAKAASKSLQKKVLADAEHDIAVIESVQGDPAHLLSAVGGKAFDDLKGQIKQFDEENLVKIRQYDDLKLTFGTYQDKVAGVTAEFVDNSKIVNKDSGQPLATARAEKVKLYLGLAQDDEDDGRWKIITIMSGAKEGQ